MGLAGGLVKSVFSKNRSIRSHDSNVRNYVVDKKRWSTVRSYLCGDEFNSVLADADSASIRSSDATVTQAVEEEDLNCENKDEEETIQEKQTPPSNQESVAAIVIQSAFRRFLARRENEATKVEAVDEGLESPRLESLGSSVEVQTGGSVETFSLKEERISVQHRAYQKARSHNAKFKEDWDDSTVSSNVSKSRIQSRLEAMTRRERALAYAFSQQLRVCSKKKPTQSEVNNMGWSWLDRWMATRPLETLSVDDRMSRQNEAASTGGQTFLAGNRKNLEEESCGSNEVSVKMNHLTITAPDDIYNHNKPGKNRLKAEKTISRRKTVPSYQISPQWIKDTRNDFFKEAGKGRKRQQTHGSSPDSSVPETNT